MAGRMLSSWAVVALAKLALAQTKTQTAYGQCSGSAYAGPTACPTSFYCSFGNPWYSQCVPGTSDPDLPGPPDTPIETKTTATVITVGPTVITTSITFLVPHTTPAPTTITLDDGQTYTLTPDPPINGDLKKRSPGIATANAATPTTLQAGQYWIRAVESPNFHKYLQTSPANQAGTAILASSKTAGQFNIVDGQLIEATGDTPLYLNVEHPTDLTQRTLATWFNTTKNPFGTFVFQGDAVTWSTPEIKRQNLAAWLVCKDQALFINTGAYAYQTPPGCADETIHFYNGATAND